MHRQRLESLPQLELASNNVGRFKPLATPLLTRTVKVKGKTADLVEKETPILGYMAVGEGKVPMAQPPSIYTPLCAAGSCSPNSRTRR